MKTAYYVLRCMGRDSFATPKFLQKNGLWSVWALATSENTRRFDTVAEIALASAIKPCCPFGGKGQPEIVKVEETTTTVEGKRELISTGSLSLLDGPCVIATKSGMFACRRTDAVWSWGTLAEATVFENQGKALKDVCAAGDSEVAISSRDRILPIHTVPGITKTYITETVGS